MLVCYTDDVLLADKNEGPLLQASAQLQQTLKEKKGGIGYWLKENSAWALLLTPSCKYLGHQLSQKYSWEVIKH